MKQFLMFFYLIALVFCFKTSSAQAQSAQKQPTQTSEQNQESPKNRLYIEVGKARTKKSQLALPPFRLLDGKQILSPQDNKIGVELYRTVYNDLRISSFFKFIRQEAYIENPLLKSMKPAPSEPNGFLFKNWHVIGTDFLVLGGFSTNKNNLTFEVYTYSIKTPQLIFAKRYSGPIKSARQIAHSYTSDLIGTLTGKKGMFKSKIVVSSDRPVALDNQSKQRTRSKEIFVMDWDGFNPQPITRHQSLALSPSWSIDENFIAYSALVKHKRTKKRNWDLFIYDIEKNKHFHVSSRMGVNSGSVWSPDDESLYLTISKDGTPDIFLINRKGKILNRITHGPGRSMNVEPDINFDGTKLAFSSDRSGRPMIYVMDIKTKKTRRVTIAGRYNASPSWSPDGKKLAFAGFDQGHFDIFVMDADGTNLVRLTTARKPNGQFANNEDPTWSPDGNHIMFVSNRTGNKQLFIANPDGSNVQRITWDQYNYFKPKWSPLLD